MLENHIFKNADTLVRGPHYEIIQSVPVSVTLSYQKGSDPSVGVKKEPIETGMSHNQT